MSTETLWMGRPLHEIPLPYNDQFSYPTLNWNPLDWQLLFRWSGGERLSVDIYNRLIMRARIQPTKEILEALSVNYTKFTYAHRVVGSLIAKHVFLLAMIYFSILVNDMPLRLHQWDTQFIAHHDTTYWWSITSPLWWTRSLFFVRTFGVLVFLYSIVHQLHPYYNVRLAHRYLKTAYFLIGFYGQIFALASAFPRDLILLSLVAILFSHDRWAFYQMFGVAALQKEEIDDDLTTLNLWFPADYYSWAERVREWLSHRYATIGKSVFYTCVFLLYACELIWFFLSIVSSYYAQYASEFLLGID